MRWAFLGIVLFLAAQAFAASEVASVAGDEIARDFAPLQTVFDHH